MMIPASYRDSPLIVWVPRIGGPVVILGAAITMLWLSWGKWPDAIVDFGRELYVPWMLAEGKVLYRDLMYFNGPLSPYLNALWFVLFGPSLRTLVWANLALLAIMMFVMYLVLRRISSTSAAFVACLVFIFLFAFSQYVVEGNYNYVCPYSHEATHGMLFSWVALACLLGHARSQRTGWLVGAGLACGLVFLTKPEFFVAIAAASFTALGLWAWLEKPDFTRALRSIGVFVAALLMPPLVAFALLWTLLPWSAAGIGTLGGWWYIWDSRIYGLKFYRVVMGMDAPLVNLSKMFLMAGVYATVLLPALVLATFASRKWMEILLAGLLLAAVVTLVPLLWRGHLLWSNLGRPLPLFMLVAGSAMAWAVTRHRRDKHIGALVLIVFSFVILGKMLLHARLDHYGFVLTMPAMLVLVLALLDWIPTAIKNSGGRQVIFSAVALAVLLVISSWHVNLSAKVYARKSIAVGVGADAFLSDQRGEAVKLAVDWLDRNTQPQDTVAVLPEGVMINYLSRRRNSTPIVNFMPPEMLMFGEDRILLGLQATPPTYVVLVHREATEYGLRFFGRDYGQSIEKWLRQNYHTAHLIGAIPLRDDRFGVLILRKGEI